jgi:hypothetical protein
MPALAGPDEAIRATVTYLSGPARYQPRGAAVATELRLGQALAEGDIVVTLSQARVEITFETGQIVRLGALTTLTLETARRVSGAAAELSLAAMAGRFWCTVSGLMAGGRFRARTRSLGIGVKGTVWRMDVAADGKTDVFVYDGTVLAEREGEPPIAATRLQRLVGEPSGPVGVAAFDEAQDETDEWVRWNKSRDRLRVMVIVAERRGGEKLTGSFAENAVLARFLSVYRLKLIDPEEAERIRKSAQAQAALRGDDAAAAAAGLEVAADLVIVGAAEVDAFQAPLPGNPWSARAALSARAVRADTAEIVAAYVEPKPRRVFDLTAEAASQRAITAAADRCASVFLDAILENWRKEARRGTQIDVVVDGADFAVLREVMAGLEKLEGVKGVQELYLQRRHALLSLTFPGDPSALANLIDAATWEPLRVAVVGLSAYKLELEVTGATGQPR